MNSAGKLVIVGAGPSGLAAALEATKNANDVLVFESSNHLGGLSRTIGYEDCLFDIGPHRFFTKNAEVNQLFNEILGNDQIRVKRLTRIFYKGKYFNYPITPLNAFLGLGVFNSIAILISYVFVRIKALAIPSQPNNFEDWVTSQFGSRLYRIFFKTYTEKVWGIPCTEISDQWASQRIKNLNLWEAIVRSLFGSRRNVIKTLVDEFGYPRMGCGQFYHKMSSIVESSGGEVRLNSPVRRICHQDLIVKSIVVKNNSEEEQIVNGDYFLCSAPLTEILEMLEPAPPIKVLEASRALRYRDHIGVHLKMRDINFPDKTFDVVISSNLIHHIAYPLKHFREVHRILKPQGLYLVQDANCSFFLQLICIIMNHGGFDCTVDVKNEKIPCSNPNDPFAENSAVPSLIFDHYHDFNKQLNFKFELINNRFSEFFIFLNSGGVTAKTFYLPLNDYFLDIFLKLDKILVKFHKIFALQRSVVLKKL